MLKDEAQYWGILANNREWAKRYIEDNFNIKYATPSRDRYLVVLIFDPHQWIEFKIFTPGSPVRGHRIQEFIDLTDISEVYDHSTADKIYEMRTSARHRVLPFKDEYPLRRYNAEDELYDALVRNWSQRDLDRSQDVEQKDQPIWLTAPSKK